MKLNYFYKLSLGFLSLFFVLNTTIASSILTSSLRKFTPQTQVAVSTYGAKRFVAAFKHPVEYYARATTDVDTASLPIPALPRTGDSKITFMEKGFERLEVQNWTPQNEYRVKAVDRDLYLGTLAIERREENIKRAKALLETGKLNKKEISALFEISESDI